MIRRYADIFQEIDILHTVNDLVYQIPKLKCLSSRLSFVFAQSIEAMRTKILLD